MIQVKQGFLTQDKNQNYPQTPQIIKEKTDRSEHIKKQKQNLFTPKAHLGEKKGKTGSHL